jgi:Tol biopolymer transport system component/chitodextrinase
MGNKGYRKRRAKSSLTVLLAMTMLIGLVQPAAWASETEEAAEGGQAAYQELIEGLLEQMEEGGGLEPEQESQQENLPEPESTVTESVYALTGGALSKISVTQDGSPSTGDSQTASVSGDGTKVAFVSNASNLVAGDTNNSADIFLHDRTTGVTKRVSMGLGNAQTNGHSYKPVINQDGRYVLFTSKATNLPGNNNGNVEDLYLYDDKTGMIERISANIIASGFGASGTPYQMSADGRYIAYVGAMLQSFAGWDVFVKDRLTGKLHEVTDHNVMYNYPYARVTISADGRYVAFDSYQPLLVEGDTAQTRDVFVYDVLREETKRISQAADGQGGNGESAYPFISANGRYVGYQSNSTNLAPGDTDTVRDVYVYDMVTGTTELISMGHDGAKGTLDSGDATISGDGRFVAFHTSASLHPEDTGIVDTYVRDRAAGTTTWVSEAAAGGPADQWGVRAYMAANGRSVLFESHATNLLQQPDADGFYDIYAYELPGSGGTAPVWEDGAELTAAASGAQYVALQWPPAVGARQYAVYRGEQLIGYSASTGYLAGGLQPNTAYSLRVIPASGDYEWGAAALELTVSTLAATETNPPSAAAGVQVVPSLGGAAVTWQNPADLDAAGSRIAWRKAGGEGKPFESKLLPAGDSGRQQIYGLMNGTGYEVRVDVYDADGNRTSTPWTTFMLPQGPRVERIDNRPDGGLPNEEAVDHDMDRSGRYIAFASEASNLVQHDANGNADVFLYDRDRGDITLISRPHGGDGQTTASGSSSSPNISGDGRFIAFSSSSSNLIQSGDSNAQYDLYLYDRDTDRDGIYDEPGTTSMERLSVGANGAEANGSSSAVDISGDGDTILMRSTARNLNFAGAPPAGTNSAYYAYYDRESGLVTPIVFPDDNGGEQPFVWSYQLSGDGHWLAFTTDSGMTAEDMNGRTDAYLYERETGAITWVSKLPDDVARLRVNSGGLGIDHEGRHVTFGIEHETTLSTVYVYEREAPEGSRLEPVSVRMDGSLAAGNNTVSSISSDGRFIAFVSSDASLVQGDTNNLADLFIRDRDNDSTTLVKIAYDAQIKPTSVATAAIVSDDGSWISFRTIAINLVRGQNRTLQDLAYDVYLAYAERADLAAAWPNGSALTALDIGRSKVTLSWSEAQEAAAYRVSYGDRSIELPATGLQATIEGLRPGTLYSFKVEARGGNGQWTTNGPLLDVTTLEESELIELAVERSNDGGVRLAWAASDDAAIAGYQVVRRASDASEVIAELDDRGTSGYVDRTAASGMTYRYQILSVDTNGVTAPYSIEKSYTTNAMAITSFQYALPFYSHRYAGIGDRVDLTLRTAAGSTVTAVVTYKDAEGAEETETVPLVPAGGSPEQYSGSFQVPEGVVSIESVAADAVKGSDTAEASALRAAIPVGGTAVLNVIGDLISIRDKILIVRSASLGSARTMRLAAAGQQLFKGLAAAGDYEIALLNPQGVDLIADLELPPLSVALGQQTISEVEYRDPVELSISVKDRMNSPIEGLNIMVTEVGGTRSYASVTNAYGFSNLDKLPHMGGKEVRIRIEAKEDVAAASERTVTLHRGRNQVDFLVDREMPAILTGTVTDMGGKPVFGAVVRVMQQGRTYRTVADESGNYQLTVPAGSAAVQAIIDGTRDASQEVEVALVKGTNEVDLSFTQVLPSRVNVKLFTNDGSGQWVGPYEIDWRVAVHFHLTVSHRKLNFANPFRVDANVGDTVTVCVNGAEAGLPAACQSTVIDETGLGEVELRLKASGAKATMELDELDSDLYKYRYSLYQVRGTSEKLVAEGGFRTRNQEWTLYTAGFYELNLFSRQDNASFVRRFTVEDGETKDLGKIALNQTAAYTGREGNDVVLDKANVPANGLMQVRGAYRNGSADSTENTRMILSLPEHSSVVEGSVVLNGTRAVPVIDSEGRLVVPIGTVAPGRSGVVLYKVQFDSNGTLEAADVAVSLKMAYDRGGERLEEWIGSDNTARRNVTLTAPSVTGRSEFQVSGSAPPGSTVQVYDQKLLLGQTTASPGGQWTFPVELPGDAAITSLRLYAKASLGEEAWFSSTAYVKYDRSYPEPISFTMQQADGRIVQLDPGQSGGTFPYVYVPGSPFVFEVRFNEPDRVKDVQFHLGDQIVPASKSADGSYKAVFNPNNTGSVGLSYTPTEDPGTIAEEPTAEELSAQLPPNFQDAKDVEVEVGERTNGGTMQAMTYSSVVPTSEGDVDVDVKMELERMLYTPTESDLAKADATGVAMYGVNVSHSFSNGVLRMNMISYIPEEQFAATEEGRKALAKLAKPKPNKGNVTALSAGQAVSVVASRVSMAFASKAGENTWKAIDASYSLYDGLGVNGMLEEMGDFLDDVSLGCSPSAASKYRAQLDSLHTKLMINEGIKAGIMIAAAVAGPSTFGLGTVALFIVSNGVGKVLDAEAGAQFDAIKAAAAADEECEDDEEDDDDDDKKKPKRKKPKRKLAEPKWIYDPSGYVYEVTADNRIEGVKATALEWNEETDSWQVWDADWYEQENPLYTNREGRYGWDVPEGRWKVLYEKEGYLPAESWEMTVLPPHFDVNVPMVSVQPPHVTRVTEAPAGTWIDVTFDRHVLGTYVNEASFAVHEAGGDGVGAVASIEGEWTLVNAVDYEGKQVARTVRFTPDSALTIGQTYTVTASGSVLSYSGIPMVDDYRVDVTVTEDDQTPPLQVEGLTVVADAQTAMLSWTDPTDSDLAKLEIHYWVQGSSTCECFEVDPGTEWVMLEKLKSNTAYEVEVRALDAAGNASSVSSEFTTGSTQPAMADTLPTLPPMGAAATVNGQQVMLQWIDPVEADLASVQVTYGPVGQVDESRMGTAQKGVEQHIVTGLQPSTAYEFRLAAVDAAGNVSSAVTVFATTGAGAGTGNGNGNGTGTGHNSGTGNNGDDNVQRETVKLSAEARVYRLFNGAVTLEVPAGSMKSEAELIVEQLPEVAKPADSSLKLAAKGYRFVLDHAAGSLAKPASLTITYDKSLLGGGDARKLGIYRWDEKQSLWIYVGGRVDTGKAAIRASFMKPGTYTVLLADYTFKDMAGHWAQEAVELMAARHLVAGTGEGRFAPNRSVTRAEFAKVAVLLARAVNGGEAPAALAGERSAFADVDGQAWYAAFVAEAAALGIVQGADGKFRPNDSVTREEMAVIIFRIVGAEPDTKQGAAAVLSAYQDREAVSDWAAQAVAYLVQAGLLQGDSGALHPNRTATRAEAAALMLRLLEQAEAGASAE